MNDAALCHPPPAYDLLLSVHTVSSTQAQKSFLAARLSGTAGACKEGRRVPRWPLHLGSSQATPCSMSSRITGIQPHGRSTLAPPTQAARRWVPPRAHPRSPCPRPLALLPILRSRRALTGARSPPAPSPGTRGLINSRFASQAKALSRFASQADGLVLVV